MFCLVLDPDADMEAVVQIKTTILFCVRKIKEKSKNENEDPKTVMAGWIHRKNLLRNVHQKNRKPHQGKRGDHSVDKNDPTLVLRCRCLKYPADGNMLLVYQSLATIGLTMLSSGQKSKEQAQPTTP